MSRYDVLVAWDEIVSQFPGGFSPATGNFISPWLYLFLSPWGYIFKYITNFRGIIVREGTKETSKTRKEKTKMKNGNSKRKNIVLAQAVESGNVAKVEKTMTTADAQRSVAQAQLEFFTTLVNQGVQEQGIEFIAETDTHVNRYVDTLQKLAQLRGLDATVEMLQDRFETNGAIDTETEIEGNIETDQINQPLTLHMNLILQSHFK